MYNFKKKRKKKEKKDMKEPIIKKYPTEIFCHAFTDKSDEAKSALEQQYCSFLKGCDELIRVQENASSEQTNLTIKGVCPNGLLRTVEANNKERLIDMKEVTFLFE
jgi:hypothetical protein